MDFGFRRTVDKGLGFASRRKRWLLALAAGCAVYALFHAPPVARKRRRLARLLGALASAAELVSDSAEALGTVSRDLRDFLGSDSDEIPRSLRQVSKIARSDEFCESLTRLTEALTTGILRGSESATELKDSGFVDRASERIFSPAGTGFASAVIGSFARNLVLGLELHSSADHSYSSEAPGWLRLACGEKARELVAESIRVFVGAAVAVYLDKTMDINFYDDVFTGLTNPKHQSQVKDVLVSVCNGAVETLVKTSHQVLSSTPSKTNADGAGDWASAALAVPSNRRLVLDVSGRVASEAARSVAEFALFWLSECVRRSGGKASARGLVTARYFGARSPVIVTVCLVLYLHVFGGTTTTGVLLPQLS